jgi:hypothetical protein
MAVAAHPPLLLVLQQQPATALPAPLLMQVPAPAQLLMCLPLVVCCYWC